MSDDTAARFATDVEHHKMTVLRDDGLYRHVQFVRNAPNTETGKLERSSFYWFELVTWPGHLTITGDCGTYTFARVEDMFTFFRGDRINPQYWAEKVQGEMRLKRYSEELFRQLVTEYIADDEEFRGPEQDWPGLNAAVEREIFGDGSLWNTEHEEGAREALNDFAFGDKHEAKCICGAESEPLPSYEHARQWQLSHGGLPGGGHRALHIRKVEGFRFTDTWEWDLCDWDWQFLWCCHAVQWGIGRYDGTDRPSLASGHDATPVDVTVTMGAQPGPRPVETVPAPVLGGA